MCKNNNSVNERPCIVYFIDFLNMHGTTMQAKKRLPQSRNRDMGNVIKMMQLKQLPFYTILHEKKYI